MKEKYYKIGLDLETCEKRKLERNVRLRKEKRIEFVMEKRKFKDFAGNGEELKELRLKSMRNQGGFDRSELEILIHEMCMKSRQSEALFVIVNSTAGNGVKELVDIGILGIFKKVFCDLDDSDLELAMIALTNIAAESNVYALSIVKSGLIDSISEVMKYSSETVRKEAVFCMCNLIRSVPFNQSPLKYLKILIHELDSKLEDVCKEVLWAVYDLFELVHFDNETIDRVQYLADSEILSVQLPAFKIISKLISAGKFEFLLNPAGISTLKKGLAIKNQDIKKDVIGILFEFSNFLPGFIEKDFLPIILELLNNESFQLQHHILIILQNCIEASVNSLPSETISSLCIFMSTKDPEFLLLGLSIFLKIFQKDSKTLTEFADYQGISILESLVQHPNAYLSEHADFLLNTYFAFNY